MRKSWLDDLAAGRDAVEALQTKRWLEPRRAQEFAVCDLRYALDTIRSTT
jgi:hypothetical protein